MGKISKILISVLVLCLLYLRFKPNQFNPVALHTAPLTPLKAQQSNPFDRAEVWKHPDLKYPEDIDYEAETQTLYTGLFNGSIVSIRNGQMQILANSFGSVFGLKLDHSKKYLYYIDGSQGVCRLSLPSHQIEILSGNTFNGRKYLFLNNLDVARDGTVYFTESTIYPGEQLLADVLEGRPWGKVFAWDPSINSTHLVVDNLYYANSVLLTPDESALLISETDIYRVQKYHLKGPKKGKLQILVDNLPGFPDNMKLNPQKNAVWIGLPTLRDSLSDFMSKQVWLKKMLLNLPIAIQMMLVNFKHGAAVKIDLESGEILQYLETTNGKLFFVTTALEVGDKLIVSSLVHNAIGYLPLHQSQEKTATSPENDL